MKLRFLLALIPLLFVIGCAGSGGGGGGGNQNVEVFSLQPTSYVLPTDGTVTVTSLTDNQIVLDGPVPDTVAVGWTVINNNLPADKQFIRKVASIDRQGSTVTIGTEAATLADVFNDAH